MITIRDDVSLEVVSRYLRRFDALPDHTDKLFVVDTEGLLKGVLPQRLEFPPVEGLPFDRLPWHGWFGELYHS